MVKKSVFMMILVVALTVFLIGGSTFAYFTDASQLSKVPFTAGTVAIKVGETPRGGVDENSAEPDPKSQPDCNENGKNYKAKWTIENTGSLPVFLNASIAASWAKSSKSMSGLKSVIPSADWKAAAANESDAAKKRTPQLSPGKVKGWKLKGGQYTYTGNNSGLQPELLKPGESVTFPLPFGVTGPKGSYSLSVCLKVTAVQVSGGSAPENGKSQGTGQSLDF